MVIKFHIEDKRKWTATQMHLFMSSLSTLYNILNTMENSDLRNSYSGFMSEMKMIENRITFNSIYPHTSKIFFQYEVERLVLNEEILTINIIHISSPGEIDILAKKNADDFKKLIDIVKESNNSKSSKEEPPKKIPDLQQIVNTERRVSDILKKDTAFNIHKFTKLFGENAIEVFDTLKRELAILSAILSRREWHID